jgi:hypothetical protein
MPILGIILVKNIMVPKNWTMPLKDWPLSLNQFEILCGDFKYDLLECKK